MSQPYRVLLLIDSMRMGGAERITAALLPHIDRTRITPILCVMSAEGESHLAANLPNVQRIDLHARRLLDPMAFRRLLAVIREERIDLIHAQLQYATVFAALARQFTDVPVIVTRHLIGDDVNSWQERARNKLEQWTIRRYVAKMITVSDASQRYYADLVGLAPERFQTIYNGIDVENFIPADDKTAIRTKLGLPVDAPIITLVGVMRPGKGQTVLLEAADMISDAVFVLVGDGPTRPQLERQAANLGNRVIFMGERSDVPDILRASDIFALPSDSEALPTVLMEAGAAALPCVASNVGGIPEIIEDGVTGIIIPPRDPDSLAAAVNDLLATPSRIESMGKAARERIHQTFTMEQQAAATIDLYERVIQASQTPA